MDKFQWAVLILPIISILGISLTYVYFQNKIENKSAYKFFVLNIGLTALVLNIVWELLHGPLYEGYQYTWEHISMCLMAAVTDMLTTLIMLFGLGLFYKNIFWPLKLNLSKILLIIVTGGTGTILLERWHIATGHWEYAENMPIVPWVEIGLTPLLQFSLLPIFVFIIGRMLSSNKLR